MYSPFKREKIDLPEEFAITAENLSVIADETTLALSGISLTIEPGEYVGIIGPNGSGKTTLENTLLGLAGKVLKVSDGSVKYGETDIYQKPVDEALRTAMRAKYFGYVPKNHGLLLDRTVAENIKRPYHLMGRKVTNVMLGDVASRFGVDDKLDTPVHALSAGLRQRVNVARGLVTNPKIVVLDEPTEALDPQHKEMLIEDLQRYAHHLGNTVINVSHEDTGADRLITLSGGKLVSDGYNHGEAA